MITEKIAEKSIEFLETAIKMAQGEAPKLLTEFLNYMVFQYVINLVQSLIWLAVVYLVAKFFTQFISAVKEEVNELDQEFIKYNNVECSNSWDIGRTIRRLNDAKTTVKILNFTRMFAVILISSIVLSTSLEHLKTIGKIVIAPKLFLIQEGSALLRGKSEPKGESK